MGERLADAVRLIDAAVREGQVKYSGRGLDLVVLPEHAIQAGENRSARERAVSLTGPVLETLGVKAREHRTNIIIPMMLPEGAAGECVSNAAVVLDRTGRVTDVYRKVFPVASADGVLEGGTTPGSEFPVFDCDFGRLGIQICWDMAYEEGWLALARQGAEIVALLSASPQTVRPASYALRGQYYVVSSTPYDNATFLIRSASLWRRRPKPLSSSTRLIWRMQSCTGLRGSKKGSRSPGVLAIA